MSTLAPPAASPRWVRWDVATLGPNALDAWRALADRAVEPNPFFRPEFVLPAVTERRMSVELIVVHDDERWLACMPFRRTARWRRIPLPCLHPWLPEYSFCATPLVDRDAVGVAMDTFVAGVRAQRDSALLVLDQFDATGPVGAALAAAAERQGMRPIVYRDFERAAWRRGPDGIPPHAAISASSSRRLRQQSRQLGRRLGGEPSVVVRTGEPAAWDTFLELENSGWKATWGTALGSTHADAAFFRKMCAEMSGTGRLQILSYEAGGRIAAMECHLPDGDVLYSFKIAYDPDLHDFSPGAQLQVQALLHFGGHGVTLADSCAAPENRAMNRMWPDRRRLQILLLPTGAPKARLLRLGLWSEATGRRGRDALLRLRRRRAATPSV